MKSKINRIYPVILSAAAMVASTTVGNSAVVFADNFESPTAAGYQITNTDRIAGAGWVRSSDGFGSDRAGVIGEGVSNSRPINLDGSQIGTRTWTETFSDPVGSQAYGFRYTNSGVTTDQGVLGTLTVGQVITVTVDVARDNYRVDSVYTNGDPSTTTFAGATTYNFSILTFDLADPLVRTSTITNNNATGVLATLSGNLVDDFDPSAVDDSWITMQFQYTVTGLEPQLGDDIAFRVTGSTSHGMIDNVSIDITSAAVPEPSAALLGALGFIALLRRRK